MRCGTILQREAMYDYKPHTFDTRGFIFGAKCLMVLAVVLVGVRYGTAFASDKFVRDEPEENVAAAAAATTEEKPTEPASPPAPPAPRVITKGTAPKVSAVAYIVGDLSTGDIYASKNSSTAYPIASISKLLVALAARETLSPEKEVTIKREDRAQTEGSPGSIPSNETFLVKDLFYPLLMESNNSVAYTFEREGGGDEFVRVMLRIAHDVGMDETLLNDSSGLSPKNSASVHDLLSLAQHIEKHEPELLEITRTKKKSVTAESGRTYPIPNLNIFTADTQFVGGKTGYTDEARQTMLTIFEVPVKNTESPSRIAIIVLGSSDRKGDIQKLKTWFEKNATFE